MDMELFDPATQNAKAVRGQRNHRSKDQDRNSDDFRSLRKANRREKPRRNFIDEDSDFEE